MFGSTWRNVMLQAPLPQARAASTNSRAQMLFAAARVMRAAVISTREKTTMQNDTQSQPTPFVSDVQMLRQRARDEWQVREREPFACLELVAVRGADALDALEVDLH